MTHSATSLTCLCWLLVPLALACLLLACLALLPGLSEEYLAGSEQWRRCGRHMGGYR